MYLTYFNDRWTEGNTPLFGAMDHSVWLGSSVFDGARSIRGQVPDLRLHLERVIKSSERDLVARLEDEANAKKCALIIGAAVDLKSTIRKDDVIGTTTALVFVVEQEGDCEPFSTPALAAACYDLVTTSKFAPDPSELVPAIRGWQRELILTVHRINALAQLRHDLDDILLDSGWVCSELGIPDDGSEF